MSMRLNVANAQAIRYTMPLKRAYGTARGKTTSSQNFVIHLAGICGSREYAGVGESQPRHKLTGDGGHDRNDAWVFTRAACDTVLGRDLFVSNASEAVESVKELMSDLEKIAQENSVPESMDRPYRGSMLGFEVALLDLIAKVRKQTISQLLGQYREDVYISISTISSSSSIEKARESAKKQHRFPMTRLKGVGDTSADLARLLAVNDGNRDANREKPLWMDINEAMTFESASSLIRQTLEKMDAEELPKSMIFEGLLPKHEFLKLPLLQREADTFAENSERNLDLRIMPDEGLWDSSDVKLLADAGGCRALNLKAPKAGGLIPSIHLVETALQADPDVHISLGGMVGTSDLTAFALHNLARALPRIDYSTSVPPTNVAARISSPLARYQRKGSNLIAPQKRLGLGTRLDWGKIEQFVLDIYDPKWSKIMRSANISGDSHRALSGVPQEVRSIRKITDDKIESSFRYLLKRRRKAHLSTDDDNTLSELLQVMEPNHVTHMQARHLERTRKEFRSALSFHAIMMEQSEAFKLGLFRPAWLLDSKTAAYGFVDKLGIRRPMSDRSISGLSEITPQFPIVIKPVRSTGSRGTYLVYSNESIVHARDSKKFSSWNDMLSHAASLMAPDHPRRIPDRWMLEELILEDPIEQTPASDLKFYTFYGQILLVQESRREDGLKVAYWDAAGDVTTTGRYESSKLEQPRPPTKEEYELVSKISREIPSPFVRIDMLRGDKDVVFGEFTPRPGYFDEFTDYWDRLFGEAWVRAEGEIVRDVLDGKQFEAFSSSAYRENRS